jgi:hypothetical protein
MSMLMVPQAIAPVHYQQDLNRRQWVHNILSDPRRCHINFRMQPTNFHRLHNILTRYYGLASTRHVDSMEALGMFLGHVGHGNRRGKCMRFRRGLGTYSKIFGQVHA